MKKRQKYMKFAHINSLNKYPIPIPDDLQIKYLI